MAGTSGRSRLCIGFVIATGLLTATALVVLAPSHAPVRRGSVADFWQAAFHLTPSDTLGGPNGAYYVDDDWCAYVDSHMHGSIVYAVPTSEIEASLGDIVEQLDRATLKGEPTAAVKAYALWRGEEQPRQSLENLIRFATDADRERWAGDIEMLSHVVAKEQRFWQRWERRQYFWATVLFEWVLFTGLALFVVWPVIRPRSFFWRVVHVAVAPVLLISPLYFGYATYTFTSHGPAGGILYPYVVVFLPRPHRNNGVDRWLLQHIPPLLESISSPIGEWISLSGGNIPSLTMAVASGAVFIVCVRGIRRLVRRTIHLRGAG